MNCLPIPPKQYPRTTLVFISGVVVGLGTAIYLAHSAKVSIVAIKPHRPESEPDAVPAETQGVHDAASH